MKKKTQLEKVVESLEGELTIAHRAYTSELTALEMKYRGRVEGLEASIKSIKQQMALKPKRRQKPALVVAGE